jgi:uncharacterized membrane protein
MNTKKDAEKTNRIEAKRAMVLKSKDTEWRPLIWGFLCGLLVVVAAGAAWFFLSGSYDREFSPATSGARSDVVMLPVSLFEDGRARHFEYVNGESKIRYFVIRSSDGVLRAAFDACDVCWPAGKGYFQDGDYMVCRNCGRRFASLLVNEVKGGCNPAPLNREVVADRLHIRVQDILKGKMYFDLDGKA